MMDARIDPACVSAVEETARLCQALGHQVEEAAPSYEEAAFHNANFTYWCGFLAGGITVFGQIFGLAPSSQNLEAATWACYQQGLALKLIDLELADVLSNQVCRSTAPFFTRYDILLTPVMAGPPLELGVLDQNAPGRDARGWYDFVFRYVPFTALFNMTGQPAMSLPLHQSPDGLPVGVQLVAPFGDEATLFRLAGQLEQAAPWAQRTPPVHASRVGDRGR